MLNEFKIINADVVIREDISVDQLIDVIEANKKYVPGLIVLNKLDTVDDDTLKEVSKKINADLSISADKETNLEKFKKAVFTKLRLIRVFMKEPGKDADLSKLS